MSKITIRQWTTILITVAVIVMNFLANALPLNGLNTGEISDRFQVFFVPAGYVFSIWGLIYIGLIAFSIYQALPAQRENSRLRRIGNWYALSGAANIAWLILWHYEQFETTLFAMFTLLLSLIFIYLQLGIGKKPVGGLEKWVVDAPFSTYLGWVTVATIANVTSVLDYVKWDGWDIAPQTWAVIMLGVAVLLAAVKSFTRRDVAFQLVLVWAFIGIALKQAAAPLVANAAWAAAALVALMIVVVLLTNRRRTA
jgi:hypothetical protein